MDCRMDGRVAIITGSSRGLGRAMAIKFADAGAHVCIVGRREDKLAETKEEVEAAGSGNYEVACAQLCGNNHYSMKALMAIHETQSGFDEWLESAAPEEFDEEEFD